MSIFVQNSCREEIVLKTEELWFKYEDVYVLKNIFLTIKNKDIILVMGPNGSGKSTLFKILAGLYRPTIGKIYLCGYDIKEYGDYLTKFVGYVPQNPWLYLFNSRVIDELMFTARNLKIDEEKIKEVILDVATKLNIIDLLNRSPFTLSEGEARRVVIASALVHKPIVLLLDEPTAGLDYSLKKSFVNIVTEINKYYKTSIIIATHDIDLLTMLSNSKLIILYNGEIVYSGTIEDALKNFEILYKYNLRTPVEVEIARRLGVNYKEIQLTSDTLFKNNEFRYKICP